MRPRLYIALFALLLGTCASAQTVPEKAKKRAQDRTEQRAENKLNTEIDQAVDDAFNAIGGLFKKKKKKNKKGAKGEAPGGQPASDTDADQVDSDEAVRNALGGLFGGGGDDDFEPFTNDVSFSLMMDMTITKKNGKQEQMDMLLAIAPTQIGQMINQQRKGKESKVQMIFNTQDGKTTMVTETEDGATGFRMRTPNLDAIVASQTTDDYMADIEITDTGETKTIDGYTCRKYTAVDGEGIRTESWITTEVNLDSDELYKAMIAFTGGGRGRAPSPQMPEGIPADGFPILSVSTTPKGERYEMRYRDIRIGEAQMDKSVFDLTGVEVMEMPGF